MVARRGGERGHRRGLIMHSTSPTPPQGDRKGPHSAPCNPRPYKDYEEEIGGSVSW